MAFGVPDQAVVSLADSGQVFERRALAALKSSGDVAWYKVNKLPELGYDHAEIIDFGYESLEQAQSVWPEAMA